MRLEYAAPTTPQAGRASPERRAGYALVAMGCFVACVIVSYMALYVRIFSLVVACFLAIGAHYAELAISARIPKPPPEDA